MPQRSLDDWAIILRPTDHVAVLKRPVKAGDELVNGSLHLTTVQSIGAGHKVALREIPDGAPVKKYGQIIGFAQGRITPGEHVHTHNLVMKDFGRDYAFCVDATPVEFYPPEKMRFFQGNKCMIRIE